MYHHSREGNNGSLSIRSNQFYSVSPIRTIFMALIHGAPVFSFSQHQSHRHGESSQDHPKLSELHPSSKLIPRHTKNHRNPTHHKIGPPTHSKSWGPHQLFFMYKQFPIPLTHRNQSILLETTPW